MKHNIEFKGLEPDARVRSSVERLAAKIDRRARKFPPDSLFLRIMIERNARRRLYKLSLVLDAPYAAFASKEEGHELAICLRDAFAEIERQLVEHKERLRAFKKAS